MRSTFKLKWRLTLQLLCVLTLTHPLTALATEEAATAAATHAWWFWPVILFFFCFVLGVIAVLAGVGGGVLDRKSTRLNSSHYS